MVVEIYFPLYVFCEARRQHGQRQLAVGLPFLGMAQTAIFCAQVIVECQGTRGSGKAELAQLISVDSFPSLAGSDMVC